MEKFPRISWKAPKGTEHCCWACYSMLQATTSHHSCSLYPSQASNIQQIQYQLNVVPGPGICQNYCMNSHPLVSFAHFLIKVSLLACQLQTEGLSEKRSFSFTGPTVSPLTFAPQRPIPHSDRLSEHISPRVASYPTKLQLLLQLHALYTLITCKWLSHLAFVTCLVHSHYL